MKLQRSNKKIINATPISVGGIQFKSRLEASVYKTLVDRGLEPLYEPDTFILFEGFKPDLYYIDGKEKTTKFQDVKYTPDFRVIVNDKIVYIEVKGFDNDVYPYKKKMFLHTIKNMENVIFMEVHTRKGLELGLDKIIESYEQVS